MSDVQMCSHCELPITEDYRNLRHYGDRVAHQEDECLRLLKARIAELESAIRSGLEVEAKTHGLRAEGCTQCAQFARELSAAKVRIAELEQDARRYQRLRPRIKLTKDRRFGYGKCTFFFYCLEGLPSVDDAVDAAIKD